MTYRPWATAHARTTFAAHEDFARDWEPRTPVGKFKRFRDHIAFGPSTEYARDMKAEIERDRPDVVVTTAIGFGAEAGAQAAGVPLVPVLTTIYVVAGAGGVPYGMGLMPPCGPTGRGRGHGALDRLANAPLGHRHRGPEPALARPSASARWTTRSTRSTPPSGS